jgi:hypothetical protein
LKPRGTLPGLLPGTRRAAVAAALCACACAPAAHADDTYHASVRNRFETRIEKPELKPGFVIEPRIESALMFVGNINLAEDSEDEVDVAGIEAAPGIYATYFRPRAQGALDYTFVGRVF